MEEDPYKEKDKGEAATRFVLCNFSVALAGAVGVDKLRVDELI